jgi:DNA-binding NtrC family response regulator
MTGTFPPRLRILVVDDREPLRTALARSLRTRYSVAIASGADAALKLVAEEHFDAVVSDFEMPPGPDGLWLLREIALRSPTTIRCLMSGERPASFARDVASGLIEHCFQKPLSPSLVVEMLAARWRP